MAKQQMDDLSELQNADGNRAVFEQLLDRYRLRLRRMVRLRLDRRLQGRLDPSDVIQEAYVTASTRLPEYLDNSSMPFFLWLRFLVCQKMLELHRHHLGVKARDAKREISLDAHCVPQASSVSLAAQLMAGWTSPSQNAIRSELALQLQQTLDQMDSIDREILALRHFEQLTMAESAEVLGIKLTAACNRYVRAIGRLKEMLPEELKELCK